MTTRQKTILIGLWIITLLLFMGYMSEAKAAFGHIALEAKVASEYNCGAKYIIYVRGGQSHGGDVMKFYAKDFDDVGYLKMVIEFTSLRCDTINGKAPGRKVRIPYSSVIYIEEAE